MYIVCISLFLLILSTVPQLSMTGGTLLRSVHTKLSYSQPCHIVQAVAEVIQQQQVLVKVEL